MDKQTLIEQLIQDKTFNAFWELCKPDELRYPNRKPATYRLWLSRSLAARDAMMKRVENEGMPRWKNPYFYVQDFPEPDPIFLSGAEQDACFRQQIPLVQVRYNDRFLICTRQTMEEFNLPFVRDWLPCAD